MIVQSRPARFQPRMSTAEIKLRLRSKGLSLADIDRKARVLEGTTSKCLRGESRYQKVRDVIARELGLDVRRIFNENSLPRPLSLHMCRKLASTRRKFEQMGHSSRSIAKATGLAQSCVSAMLNGSDFYPSMAEKIKSTFGVAIPNCRRRQSESA